VHPGRPPVHAKKAKASAAPTPPPVKREIVDEIATGPALKTYDFTFESDHSLNHPLLSSFPVVHIGRRFIGREYRSGPGSALEDSSVLSAIASELNITVSEACQRFVSKAASTKITFDPSDISALHTLAEVLTDVTDLDAMSGKHSTGWYLVWAERVIFNTKDTIFIAEDHASSSPKLSAPKGPKGPEGPKRPKELTARNLDEASSVKGEAQEVADGGIAGVVLADGGDVGDVELADTNVGDGVGIDNTDGSDSSDDGSDVPLSRHRNKRTRVVESDDDGSDDDGRVTLPSDSVSLHSKPIPPPVSPISSTAASTAASTTASSTKNRAAIDIPETSIVRTYGVLLSACSFTPGSLEKANITALDWVTKLIVDTRALDSDTTKIVLHELKPLALFRYIAHDHTFARVPYHSPLFFALPPESATGRSSASTMDSLLPRSSKYANTW